MTPLEACLLLQSIPGLGAHRAVRLISHFGSAEAVFAASSREWIEAEGIGEQLCIAIAQWKTYRSNVQASLETLERYALQPLIFGSKAYPKPLSFCADAPLVLFCQGALDFQNRKILSIVGTRQHTPQGKAFCEALVKSLQPYNPIICSGMARGIDIIAHQKALEQGLQTVACLAHGFDRIYPPEHRKFVQPIREQGCLMTDFLPNAVFRRENFPQRNRIIAGMAHATVVIESGVSGGSRNTANLAHHYGRELFAVPGRPTDAKSEGCHQLILQQKAQLLTDPEQLIDALAWKRDSPLNSSIQKTLFYELDENEQKLYDVLSQRTKAPLDELAMALGWKISVTAAQLIQMEMKGLIRALPGKQFEWI
jgi:DNA processing protein